MNDFNTYRAVRIGDTADWKLICEISTGGMSAYLKHSDPTQEIVALFEEKWKDDDNILQRIENVVYDHPQVLDDFSCDIVLTAPKAIWVPTRLVDADDDEIARLYNQIYRAAEEDILAESIGEATCLYSLVPGLNAFLSRTFPGSRVHSHLAVMASRFRERTADMPRIYVEMRHGEADILAFDGKKLLMAATHFWHDPADIEYHIYNVINVYGLDPAELQLSLSGLRDVKNLLMHDLRQNISFVMLTMMPTLDSGSIQLPPQVALLMRN